MIQADGNWAFRPRQILVYPFALIVLDLVLGGMGKALQGVIGLLAGHTW